MQKDDPSKPPLEGKDWCYRLACTDGPVLDARKLLSAVIRSGERGLGEWQHEERIPAADYRAAIDGPLPSRIVAVWIIANSVFQRGVGAATFRNIQLGR